jgi:hypothetical protein
VKPKPGDQALLVKRVLATRDDGDFFRLERLDAYRTFELDCYGFFLALVVHHVRFDHVRGA